jgi:hypothetical protein
MRMNRMIVGVLAISAASVLLAGCKQEYRLSVTNVSTTPRLLTIDASEGLERFGTGQPGQTVKHRVKIDEDFLPEKGFVQAEGLPRADFSMTKNGPKDMFFYIENGRVMGPLGKKMEVRSETSSDTTTESKPNIQIVPSDQPGRVISQEPVIE